MKASASLAIFSPAKINLTLAVLGRRVDGFHDLLSLVAPVDVGDTLWAEVFSGTVDVLLCEAPGVPTDASNLVLKAATAWRAAGGRAPALQFFLEKKIPVGAGLGGGSSNAVAALRALEYFAVRPLGDASLMEVAASVGSDCPLFLAAGPVVMRGRGEKISELSAEAAGLLRGRRVLLFKPAFGVETAWAYRALAASAVYADPLEEQSLRDWGAGRARLEEILVNTFERVVFEKYAALPVLLEKLRGAFGLQVLMSGSGSACFALLPDGADVAAITGVIREAWGREAWVAEARLR